MLKTFSKYLSTCAFVVNAMFSIGLINVMQGGVFEACNTYGLFDISLEDCRATAASIARRGELERQLISAAHVPPRVEACLFLGMGAGSLYALMFLMKGTMEVAPIHLMHAVWAVSVFVCHAQNAGALLPYFEPEPNFTESERVKPFMMMTGVQAILCAPAAAAHPPPVALSAPRLARVRARALAQIPSPSTCPATYRRPSIRAISRTAPGKPRWLRVRRRAKSKT